MKKGAIKKILAGLLIIFLVIAFFTEGGLKGIFYKRAGRAFEEIEFDKAIQYCRLVLKFDPRYDKAHYGLGLVYNAKGDYANAVYNLNKAIELNPSDGRAYAALGEIFYSENDLEKAIDYLTDAVKRGPDLAEAHYNLGAAYFKMKDFRKAIGAFEKAAKLDPSNVDVYLGLGKAYLELKDTKKAGANFMIASQMYISEEPIYSTGNEIFKDTIPGIKSTEWLYKRGIIFLLSRQINRAIQSFEDAIALYTKTDDVYKANSYRARGIIYLQQFEFDDAIKYLNNAIEINPVDGDAYYGLAEAYAALKKYEKADECYEKSIYLLRKQGKKGKAKIVFLKRVMNQERRLRKRRG